MEEKLDKLKIAETTSEELKYPHEWFELLKNEIPQPFRFEIQDNLVKSAPYNKCIKDDFIHEFCIWSYTTHGLNYWDYVCDAWKSGTLQQLADRVNEDRWNNLKVGDALYSITRKVETTIYAKTSVDFTVHTDNPRLAYMITDWFNYWTPIKPKHWKEERKGGIEGVLEIIPCIGESTFRETMEKQEKEVGKAIELLKLKGYKVLKPKTEYEEI